MCGESNRNVFRSAVQAEEGDCRSENPEECEREKFLDVPKQQQGRPGAELGDLVSPNAD